VASPRGKTVFCTACIGFRGSPPRANKKIRFPTVGYPLRSGLGVRGVEDVFILVSNCTIFDFSKRLRDLCSMIEQRYTSSL
ncbi:hypothetical protein, partial [Flavobacterium sp.]|uniref:hypothetical protein n=1 Tax=Flavobacterium sp. TaxID=239 RepID=UPI002631D290